MKLGWRHAIAGSLALTLVCLTGVGLAGQTTPAPKQTTPAKKPAAAGTAAKAGQGGNPAGHSQEMAGTFFKNVTVLKNIPVDEFMDTMGFFAASLSLNCIDCHVEESGGDWSRYADDTQLKVTARKMVQMVNAINQQNFGGSKSVTCWTCHRGGQQPTTIPSLLEQYSAPPPEDPNEYTITSVPGKPPTSDQVFANYLQALGGAQKVAAVTSWSGKGTYEGFDTEHEANPFDIYAKSPNERAQVVHFRIGDGWRVTDGKSAWIASPDKPEPLMTLTGGELAGAKMDATALFPNQLKATYPTWKVGATTIDGNDVWALIGSAPGKTTVKLFFDKKTGLLKQMTRYDVTIVGTNPIQLNYDDYRDVNGVKMPFQLTTTWTDGQSIIKLNSIQPNPTLDASQFNQPAPAKLQDNGLNPGGQ
jgi:photosynthetic reaction center cytochrome c subunit